MVIAVGNDAQWRACALALGLDDLAADARLATNAGRLEHREELVLAIAERLREAPAAHWLGRLAEAGVPAGTVKSVLETLREVEASPLTGVAPSVPGEVRLVPPLLDEHGAEIRRHGWGVFGGSARAST
jgi:crotonobetainyl-CoA:carnitine CoA-transferase CaiB-like acyl-CoA transferase